MPGPSSPKQVYKEHLEIVILAIRSGCTYDNFKQLIDRLLKLYLEIPDEEPNDIKLDCWAINRTLHHLPRKLRIRIDKMYVVLNVEYWEPPVGDPRIAIMPING